MLSITAEWQALAYVAAVSVGSTCAARCLASSCESPLASYHRRPIVFWDPESIIIARTGSTVESLFNLDFGQIT